MVRQLIDEDVVLAGGEVFLVQAPVLSRLLDIVPLLAVWLQLFPEPSEEDLEDEIILLGLRLIELPLHFRHHCRQLGVVEVCDDHAKPFHLLKQELAVVRALIKILLCELHLR